MSLQRREFCQLSKKFDPLKHDVREWYWSGKLDGFRFISDGGVTRGMLKSNVPWTNTDKDERYVTPEVCTGLLTRYGNVIHAPDSFLDALPPYPCEGELFNSNLSRQMVRKYCSPRNPVESEWDLVEMHLFDILTPRVWLSPGKLNSPNFKKIITDESYAFYKAHGGVEPKGTPTFKENQIKLLTFGDSKRVKIVKQGIVPDVDPLEFLSEMLGIEMLKPFGEGIMLTCPSSRQIMKRVSNSLKVKPTDDAEAVVKGYVSGKGKFTGMLGCLIVQYGDKTFELSGFTDLERTLSTPAKEETVRVGCGVKLNAVEACPAFPIGSTVSFRYRGLTDAGIPNEARFWRKHLEI